MSDPAARRMPSPDHAVTQSPLEDWLRWLEGVHPQEIDLGLARISAVADRLGLRDVGMPIITVAGTNGKGSTVACLEAMYTAAGQQPGSYTSPHILRYNERIRIGGVPVDDALILAAFEAIEAARAEITLTYFEFATLAAAWCFRARHAAPWILEVGLGGRLDATNCFDADLAVVTAIDLDHMEWLGDNREAIAGEKMGIARPGRPVVCSDPQPPRRIAELAEAIGAPLWQVGSHYDLTAADACWNWRHASQALDDLPRPAWLPDAALTNAAGAVMAVRGAHADLALDEAALRAGLARAQLAGRQERVSAPDGDWLLDVGHNPAAIALLADRLATHRHQGQVRLAFALMARKPLEPLITQLHPGVTEWFVLDVDDPASHSAEAVTAALHAIGAEVVGSGDAADARRVLGSRWQSGDLNVAAGSFRVVEAFMRTQESACNTSGPVGHLGLD
ncbi:bifunctional folylpolyglutamate synthase/dihydrofolate synthase [Spiribacter salinus]|uniref:bifunctional folylpolyglutamate synthase/dihydrofolate synthase n=1 Tax=Spiribacter salinus TaxID=1335746 RepID=UPI001C970392|nr:folylpolyglutamate synthase/dihydrofolate synthase family protein [Spiribacter salinus]